MRRGIQICKNLSAVLSVRDRIRVKPLAGGPAQELSQCRRRLYRDSDLWLWFVIIVRDYCSPLDYHVFLFFVFKPNHGH